MNILILAHLNNASTVPHVGKIPLERLSTEHYCTAAAARTALRGPVCVQAYKLHRRISLITLLHTAFTILSV